MKYCAAQFLDHNAIRYLTEKRQLEERKKAIRLELTNTVIAPVIDALPKGDRQVHLIINKKEWVNRKYERDYNDRYPDSTYVFEYCVNLVNDMPL